jgi:hypothetical protein
VSGQADTATHAIEKNDQDFEEFRRKVLALVSENDAQRLCGHFGAFCFAGFRLERQNLPPTGLREVDPIEILMK